VILVIVYFAIGNNLWANFVLGILSYFITTASMRFFKKDAEAVATSVFLGILFIPVFGYILVWYFFFVKTIPAQTVTNTLGNYITNNLVLSLPSTIAGLVGAAIVESILSS
jgi:uncharacterized membrane protein